MRVELAEALARAGNTAEARSLLDELLALEGSAFVSRYQLAEVFLALGARERALDELDRAAEARDPFVVMIGTDDALAALRGDARFEALRARVGGGA
jgi:tetratricopeptide (TPR) repeat protein